MSDYSGRKVAYGIKKEASRGVVAGAPTFWVPHLDGSQVTDKQEKALNNSAMNVLDTNNDSIVTKEWAEGSLVTKVQSNNVGLLLFAAFGSVATVADSPVVGAHRHTFSSNNSNQAPSLTLYKKTPNEDLAYPLSVVKSIELDAVVGEYVKVTVEFLGRKGETTSQTVAYATDQELEFTSKYLRMYVADYGEADPKNNGTEYPVKSLKVKIDRGVDAYYESGSVTPIEMHNKMFDATLEIEKRYSDTTFKTLAQNNDKKVVLVELINTDDTIGTGDDGNPALSFELPSVVVNDHETSEGLEDVAEESFTLQGLFDTTSAKQIECILDNEVASY